MDTLFSFKYQSKEKLIYNIINIFSNYYIMTYTPFIYKIPTINTDNIYKDNNIVTSSTINMPLISLGFHSFIHRTKSAMDITLKLETKNKFYYIVNPFEHNINDYKEDINSVSSVYFPNKDEPKILSRAFYKIWEILEMFDVANMQHLNMVGLAEGPGSFIQAVIKYREKFYNIMKDKIYCMTIHPENNKFIEMGKPIIDYYPKLITFIKTYKREISDKDETKINGDITKIKTINYIRNQLKKDNKYADLVTADGGFEWNNENYQEQEAYLLIYGEILSALKIQAKNGNFVLKIFETFTVVTIKMIYLLTLYYDEVIIYKPFFSRNTNSEKYVICKKFKYDQVLDKDFLDKKMIFLEKTLELMDTKQFVVDIFPKFILTNNFLDIFKYINITIANTQQIMINMLVQYIKSNNYFGDEYHKYRENQILANKWWISTYFVESKPDFTKLVKDTIHYNESELTLFINKLN